MTAPFAALRLANPAHRRGFIFWQVLGITDLVNALALGKLVGVIDPHGIPTVAMTVLPISYIPTFAVPLFLILHIICIAQARSAEAKQSVRLKNNLDKKNPYIMTIISSPVCPNRAASLRWREFLCFAN